ncbi:MAG TPA: hypothetical protein VGB81_15240 [Devosia sp.]
MRFDKTINLGHILTMISFLLLTLTQWNMMDKRVVVLEEFRGTQRDKDTAQDTITREKAQEVKDALRDVKNSIEKLGDRMGAR